MALSLCRWNPWFDPQQSGHCYPLPRALQSCQLNQRDDYVRTLFSFEEAALEVHMDQIW